LRNRIPIGTNLPKEFYPEYCHNSCGGGAGPPIGAIGAESTLPCASDILTGIPATGRNINDGGMAMESIYKIIDVVGTSKASWEEAAKNAVETAGKSLEDLRIAEVVKLDMAIEKGKVVAYRARVNISFKYRSE
jgi:hypothetical protein